MRSARSCWSCSSGLDGLTHADSSVLRLVPVIVNGHSPVAAVGPSPTPPPRSLLARGRGRRFGRRGVETTGRRGQVRRLTFGRQPFAHVVLAGHGVATLLFARRRRRSVALAHLARHLLSSSWGRTRRRGTRR